MEYNKLVRDRIPKIIEKSGKIVHYRKLDHDAIMWHLLTKLNEEAEEFKHAYHVEELADLLEVVYGLANHLGVSDEELDYIRLKKQIKNGRFKAAYLLESVQEVN